MAKVVSLCPACMVAADLQGKDTQGIALIRLLYDLLKDGAGRFGTPIRVVKEGPAPPGGIAMNTS